MLGEFIGEFVGGLFGHVSSKQLSFLLHAMAYRDERLSIISNTTSSPLLRILFPLSSAKCILYFVSLHPLCIVHCDLEQPSLWSGLHWITSSPLRPNLRNTSSPRRNENDYTFFVSHFTEYLPDSKYLLHVGGGVGVVGVDGGDVGGVVGGVVTQSSSPSPSM